MLLGVFNKFINFNFVRAPTPNLTKGYKYNGVTSHGKDNKKKNSRRRCVGMFQNIRPQKKKEEKQTKQTKNKAKTKQQQQR